MEALKRMNIVKSVRAAERHSFSGKSLAARAEILTTREIVDSARSVSAR